MLFEMVNGASSRGSRAGEVDNKQKMVYTQIRIKGLSIIELGKK